MKNYHIANIPGDGVGKEVADEAVKILKAAADKFGFGLSFDEYDWSCDYYLKHGEMGPENVAAFFAEPILGAGGVIVPPPGYQRRTQEVCRKYEVLYVSDEVVTGFGRLGHMLASEPMLGLTPDIITCAKGISSGYAPLGATLISDAIYEVIRTPKSATDYSFAHGFTYSGHALCCAAGLKNIEILEREGIPCGPINDVAQVLAHPQVRARNMIVSVDDPVAGKVAMAGNPIKLSTRADPETRAPGPELDADRTSRLG